MIELFFCCKSRKKNRNRCITAGKSCIKSGKNVRSPHGRTKERPAVNASLYLIVCQGPLAELPLVISTKRSAWRDLSTKLEMTWVEMKTSLTWTLLHFYV